MVELVVTIDSKSIAERRVGSSPTSGTKFNGDVAKLVETRQT